MLPSSGSYFMHAVFKLSQAYFRSRCRMKGKGGRFFVYNFSVPSKDLYIPSWVLCIHCESKTFVSYLEHLNSVRKCQWSYLFRWILVIGCSIGKLMTDILKVSFFISLIEFFVLRMILESIFLVWYPVH